ncbi:MAG: WbqC family protein [Gammaproteobacteria bacterium]|nr:WbqC family protein [Gammaproteobacteria bacterium]MBU1623771.1 WbqC family protein [Gammaproteobacteria bacterium]
MTTAAIMQPYFFPYIGYFQLIAAADLFVVYDNIKYTKKGWINRNRMLLNGTDAMFSLPLKKDSDSLDVVQRELATDFNRDKLLNQLKSAYQQAPYFSATFPLLEKIIRYEDVNLFRFLHHSIVKTCEHLGINTEIRISSGIDIDHALQGQDKVLSLCKAVGAHTYVNAIGGVELYSKEVFHSNGIELKFIKSLPFEYAQSGKEFVPWLSIVDVMMFNPLDTIHRCISTNYELI